MEEEHVGARTVVEFADPLAERTAEEVMGVRTEGPYPAEIATRQSVSSDRDYREDDENDHETGRKMNESKRHRPAFPVLPQ